MIDCKHLEWVDNTPWHGDIFDHPSYKSVCTLKEKDVHHFYTCSMCKEYVPNYEGLSDVHLRDEFRAVQHILQVDDRMRPLSWAFAAKLLDRRDRLVEEAKKRNITLL